MSLMTAIEVGTSGLTAQRTRLELLISNLANAHTTRKPEETPFRRKDVIFTATSPEESFGTAFNAAVQGVEVSQIFEDTSDPIEVSDPGHKHADENGIVRYPNIEPLKEMANIVTAARSYEANLQAVNAAKEMQQKTLEILK